MGMRTFLADKFFHRHLYQIYICFWAKRERQGIKNGRRYLILNTTNEALNLISHLLVNYANLIIPVALVTVLNGFQSAFVFIFGVIGTIIFPKYIKEDLSKNNVIQKILCIILSIVGLIILVY